MTTDVPARADMTFSWNAAIIHVNVNKKAFARNIVSWEGGMD